MTKQTQDPILIKELVNMNPFEQIECQPVESVIPY